MKCERLKLMLRFYSGLGSLIILFSGCSTTLLVHSSWENDQIAVDGQEIDWQYRTFYLNDQNLNLGIRNNGDNLFLFIKIIDQHQRRNILSSGFTLWFDPTGGNTKVVGVRIPGRMRGRGEGSNADDENIIVNNSISEIEILHGEKVAPTQIPIVSLKNLQFAASRTRDVLIYELKIPLTVAAEGGFALNQTTNNIGIGFIEGKFETSKKDRIEGDFSGTMEGTGEEPTGGMSGQRGKRGGGRRGEFSPEGKTEPLDVWLKVDLAEKKK
jgi:hypothetical protein